MNKIILVGIICLCVVTVIYDAAGIPGLVFLVLLIALCVWGFVKLEARSTQARQSQFEAEKNRQREIFELEIQKHAKELARKESQLVIDAGYGLLDTSAWDKEKHRFTEKILLPKLYSQKLILEKFDINKIIDVAIKKYRFESNDENGYCDSFDPIQYEHFCADQLNKLGWQAKTTKASGDQGADIIAKKGNYTIVAQCKRYSNPVGNKAVQEVFSAKQFYDANACIVITNSGYTRSAKEAANRLGVVLLHHTEIPEVESMLSISRAQ